MDLLELAVHGDLKLLETPLERSLEREGNESREFLLSKLIALGTRPSFES